MKGLWRDLGFGLRLLRRRPGFTAAALLSLVLGIGLNTAIFTLLDAIFLRPLPVDDLESLAAIYTTRQHENGEYVGSYGHSYENYLDLRERSSSFADLAIHLWHKVNISGGSGPVRGTGMFVSANYFDVLGLEPHAGRFFLPEEDATPGTHPVAVLSHGAWTRWFGADPDLMGGVIEVNGEAFTLVGVAPERFKGTEIVADVDVWIPVMMFEAISPYGSFFRLRGASLFRGTGRLREGVGLAEAGAELHRLSRQLEEAFPAENEGLGARVRPLLEGTLMPEERSRHLGYGTILMVAVGLILLMSCLNVASLLLVRGLERAREIAIRQSLGASRGRTLLQLISENLTLFVLGGALSLPVARLSLDLLWRFRPPQFAEDALDLEIDATIFGFALLTALVTGLIFGLLPAMRVASLDLVSHLKGTGLAEKVEAAHRWLTPRRLLVIGQVALASIALVGAGLFIQSLRNAHRIDVGFDADALLALTFAPGEQGYDEARARGFYRRALDRVEALPGVKSASLSENRLLRGGIIRQQIFLEGQDEALEVGGRAIHRTNAVFPGFFETAGIPLLRGRDFDEGLRADGPLVAIVNETLARIAWPGEDAVGKRFRFDYPDRPLLEVIGVARDIKYRQIHEVTQGFVYLPEIQRHASAMTLHVRAEGHPSQILQAVREEVHRLAPELPLADVRTLSSFVSDALWIERTSATLLTVFGALALALSTLGVYSVLAEAVSQRRREVGLRMAIGAGRGDVLRVVLRDGLRLVVSGLAVGLVGAFVILKVSSSLSGQLYDVSVSDPRVYAAAASVLLLGALFGFFVPSWRAIRTNPVRALRGD